MKKRIWSVLLSIVLSASMVMPAFAAEPENVEQPSVVVEDETEASSVEQTTESLAATEESLVTSTEEEIAEESDATSESASETETETESEAVDVIEAILPQAEVEYLDNFRSSDELYEGYVKSLFGLGDEMELQATLARDSLNSYEKIIYDVMKEEAKKIAAGEKTETIIKVPVTTLGIQNQFNTADFGADSADSEKMCKAIEDKWDFKTIKVVKALMDDMPYEMYWCDYSAGLMKGGDSVVVSKDGKTITYPVNSVNITLYVEANYRKSDEKRSEVDSEKAQKAIASVNNAKSIVTKYASAEDVDKLEGYMKEICAIASYDAEAGTGVSQLINVFDKDASTKASAEGFARAFQYLCDNTSFKSDKVKSYILEGSVTETVSKAKQSPHMWNMVSLDNGKNYLVDVAYCSNGMYANPDGLFLAGATKGSIASGGKSYVTYSGIHYNDYAFSYTLFLDCAAKYTASELAVSAANYYAHSFEGLTNKDVNVEWDDIVANNNGVFTIGYKATAVCKCGRCLKENPSGVAITLDSGTITLGSSFVATAPSCLKNGKIGAGAYITKDFLGTKKSEKYTIPVREIASYGEHDWGAWTKVNANMNKRQCKRCKLIEEQYPNKTTPTCVAPTGLTATYGQKLGQVTITNPEGNTAGSWSWADEKLSVGDAGTHTYYATFTPTDGETYHPVKNIEIEITVNKADHESIDAIPVEVGSLAGCYALVTSPVLPDGAELGTISDLDSHFAASVLEDGLTIKIISKGVESLELTNTFKVKVINAKNYNNYYIPIKITVVNHVHAIDKNKFHKEVPATQTSDGVKAYYECANGCDKKLDSQAAVISDDDLKIERLDIIMGYNANGSYFADDGNEVKKYPVKYAGSNPSVADPVARTGYDFDGWYTEAVGGTKVTIGSIVAVTEDTTYYAHWTGKNSTVKFYDDTTLKATYTVKNGSTVIDAVEAKYLDEDAKFPYPGNKDGKIFVGWYTAKNGAGEKLTETSIITDSVDVYAYYVNKGMSISLANDSYTYTGAVIKPEVSSVTFDGVELVPGTDYTVAYKNNTKAYDCTGKTAAELDKSAPAVVITGKGNYSGTYKKFFTIDQRAINTFDVWVADLEPVIANGKKQAVIPTVTFGKIKLANNRDFTVQYYKAGDSSTPVTPESDGTYIVSVTGCGNYKSTVEKTFIIKPSDNKLISKLSIRATKSKPYTGNYVTLTSDELVIKDGSTPLVMGTNYSVQYQNNIGIGTAAIKITGKGKYAGSKIINFQIVGTPLTKAKQVGFKSAIPYAGGNAVLQPMTFEITDSSKVTTELIGADITKYNAAVSGNQTKVVSVKGDSVDVAKVAYTVDYSANTEIGKVTVIYTGVNAYSGKVTKTYNITGKALSTVKVKEETFVKNFTYTGNTSGEEQTGLKLYTKDSSGNEVEVKWAKASDYATMSDAAKKQIACTVTYDKNVNAGTATMTFQGVNEYTGSFKKTYKINQYDIKANAGTDKVSITIADAYAYNKAGVTPDPIVYFGSVRLEKGKDYTVTYANNKAVNNGTGAKAPVVKITGKGNFKGVMESVPFAIEARDLQTGGIRVVVNDKAYKPTAGNWKSAVSVVDADGKKLALNSDYSKVEYTYYDIPDDAEFYEGSVKTENAVIRGVGMTVGEKDIVPAGVVIQVKVTGKGKNNCYSGFITQTYKIGKKDINSLKFKINPVEYTGREVTIKNSDIIWNEGTVFVDGSEFVIDRSSYKNNVKKGKATVVIRGTGDYCGSRTITFTIGSKSIIAK